MTPPKGIRSAIRVGTSRQLKALQGTCRLTTDDRYEVDRASAVAVARTLKTVSIDVFGTHLDKSLL